MKLDDCRAATRAADERGLRWVRRHLGVGPVVPVARTLSAWGEHAAGWVVVAAAGAVLQPNQRRAWLDAGGLVLLAHASSVAVKRVVRRPRPDLPDCPPLVKTPSRLSFPSSHATSTTAAAVALPALVGAPWQLRVVAAGAVGAMSGSRVLLGVHYPTDVIAGSLLGGGVVVAAGRLRGRRRDRR